MKRRKARHDFKRLNVVVVVDNCIPVSSNVLQVCKSFFTLKIVSNYLSFAHASENFPFLFVMFRSKREVNFT